MPPRSETLPAGVQQLKNILTQLNAQPKLSLSGVKRLRLSLAAKKDHYGALHFVDDSLPRIRWANPNMDIIVRKADKTPREQWKAEMQVEFESGKVETVDMQDKYSSTILGELMEKAGDDIWKRHVADCKKTGAPILPEAPQPKPTKKPSEPSKDLPTLDEFLQANPAVKAQQEKKVQDRLAKLAKRKERREKKAAAAKLEAPITN